MGIQAPAEVKYGLIHEATRLDDNRLSVSELCRIAGVSRSGYPLKFKIVLDMGYTSMWRTLQRAQNQNPPPPGLRLS